MARHPLSLLLVSLSVISLALAGLSAPVFAVSLDGTKEVNPIDLSKLTSDRKVRRARYPVRSRVSRYLAAAAEASDVGEPEEGRALLDNLDLRRLNAMERALVFRLSAYLSYSAGEYEDTIASFRQVLAEEIMAPDAEARIRFNIAQIYASQSSWQETIDAVFDWAPWVGEADPLAYYLLGIAYYQLNQVDTAIQYTEKAVDLSVEPPEGWLQLLAALYVQKEDYSSAAPIFEELVSRFPRKAYWVQLSLIYGAQDKFQASLSVQQIAYLQGFLNQDGELRRLARSYLYHDLPYPAARVLETGLANGSIAADVPAYELLANSWIAAREFEKSVEPLTRAAELSEDGNLYVRLGQVYLQRENFGLAAEALEKAAKKGGLKNAGSTQLLLGIVYYNKKEPKRARAAFKRARRFDSARAEAERWITHLDNENGNGDAAQNEAQAEAQSDARVEDS